MFEDYKPHIRDKLIKSLEYAQGQPKRDVKCPKCRCILFQAYGRKHCCIYYKCWKCNYEGIMDIGMFRTMKLNQVYNEEYSCWYVPPDDELTA